MKKFFDRYLFSRISLQILFCVFAIFVLSILLTCIRNNFIPRDENNFYKHLSWGFRQLADGGSVTQTLEHLDAHSGPANSIYIIIALAVLSWIIGLILCSFVTGAIVNAFDGRKDRIKSGKVRYKFKNHGIILGWDYQGTAVVKNMLSEEKIKEVLIVTTIPAEEITAVLCKTLRKSEMAKIYIYHCSVNVSDNIKDIQAEFAEMIVILGEQDNSDKSCETLHIEKIIQKYVRKKMAEKKNRQFTNLPIKLYLHIDDYMLYTQARAEQNGFIEDEIFDIELCNFYESWAWRCWSKITDESLGNTVCDNEYLPLRYKKDSKKVELFVIGSSLMAQAFINYAIPLLNYGKNCKHCKITLFDDEGCADMYLPKKHLIDSLPEVDIVCQKISGISNEANDIIYKAAVQEDTSVTVVIAIKSADAAVKTYAALSHLIRREHISVLLCQSTESISCIDKNLLLHNGDGVELRYFGMTDILPWLDPSRDKYGKYVNYSYEIISKIVNDQNLGKNEPPEKFFDILRLALECPFGEKEEEQSSKEWNGIKRWKRWSSINASDSFKEKAFAFPNCTADAEDCVALMKAEHNRWWAERLMSGWSFAEQKSEKLFLHPSLVEFEKIDAKTNALDLLCILAMKNAGLFKKS